MQSLHVLITNMALLGRSGTETYTRDLALALRRRGHHSVVYSPRAGGGIAREIRDGGVPVCERLSDLEAPPDVIHGQHNLPAVAALLQFPGVPAVFVCHDATAWHDAPPRFPRIRRYVAVDHRCRERLVLQHAIAESEIRVIYNSVDLDRFTPRGGLPDRPRRALLFSHYAKEHTHLPAVREACARTGLDLEVVGSGVNNVCAHPEAILGRFDLVFAKSRSALEALAVGAAVVLCGSEGLGPMVRLEAFDDLRRFNFGRRALTEPVTAEALVKQIRRYDPRETAAVSARVRAEASLDTMVSELLSTYAGILADVTGAGPDAADAEARAVARYLESLEPTLFASFEAQDTIQNLEAEAGRLAVALAQARAVSGKAAPRVRGQGPPDRSGEGSARWRWLRPLRGRPGR
jgi:hypothetical protein